MEEVKAWLEQLDVKQALGIGVIVAVLYYFALYNDGKYIDASINDSIQAIENDTATLNKVEKALEDKKKFETDIREITEYMKDFQEFFPENYNGNDLVAKISSLAEKNALTIVNLKPMDKENEFKNYPETAVTFAVEGDFHKIMQFVSDITGIKKAMDFKTMKFEVAQPSDDPRIRLTTVLIVYGNSDGFGVENG